MGYEPDQQIWAISQQISDALADRGFGWTGPRAVYAWIDGPQTDEDVEDAADVENLVAAAIGGPAVLEALEGVARVLPGVCYFLGIPGSRRVVGGIDVVKVRREVIDSVSRIRQQEGLGDGG